MTIILRGRRCATIKPAACLQRTWVPILVFADHRTEIGGTPSPLTRQPLAVAPSTECAALDRIAAPMCVASSGSHDKIRFTLGHTGLPTHFEGRIFSATDVARGKPAPGLFLHAAARMGFDPERTIVVEDSPRGVEAGVAAGMVVLAYADHVPSAELATVGGRAFTDMADLPSLLRDLLAE